MADRRQIGARDVNFLVLAAVTPRFRVPLIWSVLEGRGCSATGQRIALLRRSLAVFDVSTIRLLLADRGFIGAVWIDVLHEDNIPLAIRLKGKMHVTTEEGHTLSLNARLRLRLRLRLRQRTRTVRAWLGTEDGGAPRLPNFAAKRLGSGEILIVVSNGPARLALAAYRKRLKPANACSAMRSPR